MVMLSKDMDGDGVSVVRHRAHRRVRLRVEIDVWSDNALFHATTGNVSEGGLYFITAEPLPLGAPVELTLSLPHSPTPHRIHAKVQWAAGGDGVRRGYGVRFIAMCASTARELRDYISASRPVAATAS